MDYPAQLFTRQQIAEMTGIDSSTLNYWMREGVLRASEGGAGKGSHRRFGYQEINLAALLHELRQFGIGTVALARLARRFHHALDWMAERGISNDNLNRVFSAYLIRQKIIKEGFYQWRITREEERSHFAGHEQIVDGHGWVWVDLDWEQAVAFWFRPRSNPHPEFELVPEEIAMVGSWQTEADLRAFRDNQDYFSAISSINLREIGDEYQSDPRYFYRDADGDLTLTPDRDVTQRTVGFIGIDTELLTYRLWSGRL